MTSSGDDLHISDQAILIYTWVAFGVLCPIINICGIVTNIINIMCFTKQGFQESVNISLLGLSISDLGSLTTMVWTSLCLSPALTTSNLSFDPVEVGYLTTGMAHFSFTRVSGCLTAMITLERCLCVTFPLKIKNIITPRRASVINACVFIIFFCSGAPVFAVNRLGFKLSPIWNKTVVGIISTANREYIEMVSFTINNFVLPSGAFVIILTCTVVISFKLSTITAWRKKVTITTQVDRVSSRNQKTSKMVVMISTLFIVCFVPVTIIMLAVAFIPELSFNGKYLKITIVIAGLGYILESINSSSNIVIYYHMSSKYRHTFWKVFCKDKTLRLQRTSTDHRAI